MQSHRPEDPYEARQDERRGASEEPVSEEFWKMYAESKHAPQEAPPGRPPLYVTALSYIVTATAVLSAMLVGAVLYLLGVLLRAAPYMLGAYVLLAVQSPIYKAVVIGVLCAHLSDRLFGERSQRRSKRPRSGDF